jgi:hypothetical protein
MIAAKCGQFPPCVSPRILLPCALQRICPYCPALLAARIARFIRIESADGIGKGGRHEINGSCSTSAHYEASRQV